MLAHKVTWAGLASLAHVVGVRAKMKRSYMKHILLLSLFFSLLGCGSGQSVNSETSNSLQETDLTGTWVMVNEIRRMNAITGEYLSSKYVEYRYVMEEKENGVVFNKCWDYGGGNESIGVKVNDYFYMDFSDVGLSLNNEGELKHVSSFEKSSEPDSTFQSVKTLRKISDNVQIDSGSYILNGPVSIEEYEHVCVWQVRSNVESTRTVQMIVPYGNTQITLHFWLIGSIQTGEYYYNDSSESEAIEIDIISNDRSFSDQVGTNSLWPQNVSINITESSDLKMTGTFAFIGQDNGSYNGQFEVYLKN